MANKVEPRFDPLTGELLPESTAPKQAQPAASADNPLMGLSGAEMEKLDKMPVEQLRTLVRTICGAMNGLPLKDPEEIAAAFKLKCAYEGLRTPDITKMLAAMGSWFDREKGKPKASLDVSGKIGILDIVLAMGSVAKEPVTIDNGGIIGGISKIGNE